MLVMLAKAREQRQPARRADIGRSRVRDNTFMARLLSVCELMASVCFQEDGRLLGPVRILVMVFETGIDLGEPGVVVGCFVAADGLPVEGLGGGSGVGVLLEHGVVPAFGFGPALVLEVVAREAEHELCAELLLGKIAFTAEAFDAAF